MMTWSYTRQMMADELMADDFEDEALCDEAYEPMFTENWFSRLISRLFKA